MISIENQLAKMLGYIFMFLMILRVVVATDFFSIYKSLIGFMFALIVVYITQRVVYVEVKRRRNNISLTDFTGLLIAVVSFGLGYLIARHYKWSNKTNQLVSITRTITTEDKKKTKGDS